MPRVLVVDDDEQVREFIHTALEEAGYEVMDAEDGRQALKCFRERPADLLVIDIFMLVQEGLETILELKRASPRLKSIAISGGGLTGNLEFLDHARTFGADRALTKPLVLHDLLEAVSNLVGPGVERA